MKKQTRINAGKDKKQSIKKVVKKKTIAKKTIRKKTIATKTVDQKSDEKKQSSKKKVSSPKSRTASVRKPGVSGSTVKAHQLPPGSVQKARHPLLSLGILGLVVGLLVGGLWYVSSSGMVTNRFKPQLESELSKALMRSVTVEKLEGGLFDRVVLKNVRIADAEHVDTIAITIDRVVVQYSLWDILVRKRSLAESLHQIQLIKPLIQFERSPDGKWKNPTFLGSLPSAMVAGPAVPSNQLPKIKITLYDGEVRFKSGLEIASVYKLRGLLNLRDPSAARLYLSGRTDKRRRQNLKVSGIINLTTNTFRASLDAAKVHLRPIERVVRISDVFEIASGQSDLKLKIKSRAPTKGDLIPGTAVEGKLVLYDLALKTKYVSEHIKSVFGIVNLKNKNLTIKNVQALLGNMKWSAQGTIKNLQKPWLNIRVKSDKIELADLLKSFPRFQKLNTAGVGNAAILIRGQADKMAVTANIKMAKGKIGKLKIRRFESISRYQAGKLKLILAKGIFARGWIEGKGQITLPEHEEEPAKLFFQGRANDVELNDIGDLVGMKDIRGRLDGVLALNGELNNPMLTATVASSELEILGSTLEDIRGQLEASAQSVDLKLKTSWGPIDNATLEMKANRQRLGWDLNYLKLFQEKRLLINAGGHWQGKPSNKIDGFVKTNKLPLRLIPLLPKELSHLDGHISFDGTWNGVLQQPVFKGTFITKQIHTSNQHAIDARGSIFTTKDKITLDNVLIDKKRITINGEMLLKPQPRMSGKIRFAKLPVAHLASLTGVKDVRGVGGTVSGLTDLAGGVEHVGSKGKLSFRRLKWNDVRANSGTISFSSKGDHLWIKEFELTQSTGKFQASFEADLGQKIENFRLLSWMDKFEIGNRIWNGELKIRSLNQKQKKDHSSAATLTIQHLEVDNHDLPDAKGIITFADGNINLGSLAWGKQIVLDGMMSLSEKPTAQFRFLFKETNLQSLRILLDKEAKPLHTNVSGEIKGQLNDKHLSTQVFLKKNQSQLRSTIEVVLPSLKNQLSYQGKVVAKKIAVPLVYDLFMLGDLKHSPKGELSGTVQFDGGGKGVGLVESDLIVSKFKFGPWDFKALKTKWIYKNDVVDIQKLEAVQLHGGFKLEQGKVMLKKGKAYPLKARMVADRFNFLSRDFFGHFDVEGSVHFDPIYDMQLKVQSDDFKINLHDYGKLGVDIQYLGEKMTIDSFVDLPYELHAKIGAPPNGNIIFKDLTIAKNGVTHIKGHGFIGDPGTLDIFAKIHAVGAETIAQTLGWPQEWQGTTYGSIHYRDPEKISRFDINVKIENGSVIGLPFDIFSGKILIDHDWLYFKGAQDACVLHRSGKYTMHLSGKLPLPQSEESSLRMQGEELDIYLDMPRGDLSYLVFIPYVRSAKGKSSLHLNIRGTFDYPTLNGRATISDGSIQSKLYTPLVENIEAELEFDDNKLIAHKLRGKIGEGDLKIAAIEGKNWVTEFRRMVPHNLNVDLKSKKGRIKLDATKDYEFVSAFADIDIQMTGTLDAPIFSGRIDLSDGQFTFPAIPLTPFTKNMKPSNVTYHNLKLTTKKNVWFDKEVIRGQLAQDQTVIFNGDRHDFRGEGTILVNRGSLVYLENDFTLDPNEENAVVFMGKEKPRINGLAKTTIRNVAIKDEGRNRDAIIYMRVTGEVGQIKIKLESDPVMTQSQIMSLLTVGEDFSNWSSEELDQRIQAAGARVLGRLAGNLIGREIEKSIKKYTPVDVFDIRLGGVENLADSIMSSGNTGSADSVPGGTNLLQDTEIDVGKYLTDDLFLNYRGVLKEKNENDSSLAWQSYLGLEYNIDPSRKIKVYKNFDSDSDQEMFWGIEGRVQFEGWSPKDGNSQKRKRVKAKITPTATPYFK